MKAVQEIKGQGQNDKADEQRKGEFVHGPAIDQL